MKDENKNKPSITTPGKPERKDEQHQGQERKPSTDYSKNPNLGDKDKSRDEKR